MPSEAVVQGGARGGGGGRGVVHPLDICSCGLASSLGVDDLSVDDLCALLCINPTDSCESEIEDFICKFPFTAGLHQGVVDKEQEICTQT